MPPVSHGAIYVPLPVGGAWSPLTVSSDFWFKADDLSTFSYSSGSDVSQWRDKSGFNRHLTPQSGTLNTVLTSNVKNSKPGVLFSRSGSDGSVLETTSAFTTGFPNTVVMAFYSGAGFIGQSNGTIWMVVSSASQAILLNSGHPALYAGTAVTDFGGLASNATPYIYYAQFDGSTSHAGVNSAAADVGPINPGPGQIVAGNIQIGRTGSNLVFEGYMLEMFGYPSASTTDRDNAIAYINSQWGTF